MKTILKIDEVIEKINDMNSHFASGKHANAVEYCMETEMCLGTFKSYLEADKTLLARLGKEIIYDRKRKLLHFSSPGTFEIELRLTWKDRE